MGSLTVHFRGVCVHFPVPELGHFHRVVLPDATALRIGHVGEPGAREPLPYVLSPHFARLKVPNGEDLTVPGLINKGLITERIRLCVPNHKPGDVHYSPAFHNDVFNLERFVGSAPLSREVVLDGGAACYFDVKSGFVDVDTGDPAQIDPKTRRPILAGVQITIETHGKPTLFATPMGIGKDSHEPVQIHLPPNDDDVCLFVGNVGRGCGPGGADGVNFLLNFLVLQEGIPRQLGRQLPKPVQMSFVELRDEAIRHLLHVYAPDEVNFPELFNSDLSCSNTQYP